MIGEILLVNDRVTLPGLGCLVAENVPASFSDNGFTINPPFRRLRFDSSEGSDRLLSAYYAQANNIPEEAAEEVISNYLHELRLRIDDRKTISIPGIGKLRSTRNGSIVFAPDSNADIFPDGFGLRSVSLKSLYNDSEEFEEPVLKPVVIRPVPAKLVEGEPVEEEPAAEVAAATEIAAEELAAEETAAEEVAATVKPDKKKVSAIWWILLGIIALAILACAVFVILARTNPDLVDPLLYSPEELEIIRS